MIKKATVLLGGMMLGGILQGAEVDLKGAQEKPFEQVGLIEDVNKMIEMDKIDELKRQVAAGLKLGDYTFNGKALGEDWSTPDISPLYFARSGEMVDFLASQESVIRDNWDHAIFNPLEELLSNIEEEEDTDLKQMSAIGKMIQLGVPWPEDQWEGEYDKAREKYKKYLEEECEPKAVFKKEH